ncbi:hypothetical protein GGR50DRAFT_684522 [Xylaria sp. CBS 124048]|nr:hypothetical protein GGR50DRAFT_684522 [Xylaria sp. CBS 124048]
MEESAPKRRKTSPTTSVSVDESGESSAGSAARRSSRLARPSFASPTRASLARSNPDVLERRTLSREGRHNEEPSVPAASEPEGLTSNRGNETNPATARPETESEGGRPQGGNKPGSGVERLVRTPGGKLPLKQKRSPEKPSPRPLPAPSAEEEELIDPFKGRKLRRSPPPGVLPKVLPEEPELPPTPIQQGLSDPSSIVASPRGIHNTPLKRPRRSRALAATMYSSPLKQAHTLRQPAETASSVLVPIPSLSTKEPLRNEPKRKRFRPKFHPARQIQEDDPLADKKALRDSLLAEVAQLEEDLKVASRENKRLHELQRSHRTTEELPELKEQSRLLDVLSRHALPPEKETPPDPMSNWLKAAMNPIAFLPFGQANALALPPFVMPGPEKDEAKTDSPPPDSHHPVPMTADEELPYLQVFSPLTFTSTITTIQQQIPKDGEEGKISQQEPLLQRHAISVASSPPGSFMATVDMTVNTKTLSISDLAIPHLDPSAASELGPFVEKILRDGNKSSALTRNVSVITWAMGEWVRVATRRARFWHAARNELGSAESIARCAAHTRRHTRRKPVMRGQSQSRGDREADEENSDSEDDDDEEQRDQKSRPSRADIISLLGRTSLDIDLSGVAGGDSNNDDDDDDDDAEPLIARVQWRIEFDWTGEAKSKIGLLLCVPAKWRASDGKGSLAGLPDIFDKLLGERKDPLEAVKIVVSLIVGDGRP